MSCLRIINRYFLGFLVCSVVVLVVLLVDFFAVVVRVIFDVLDGFLAGFETLLVTVLDDNTLGVLNVVYDNHATAETEVMPAIV